MRRKILLIDSDPIDAVRFRRACDHVDLEGRLVVAADLQAALRVLGGGDRFGAIVVYDDPGCWDLDRFAGHLAARLGRSCPPIIVLFDPENSLSAQANATPHIAARLPRPRESRAYDELACTIRDFWMHPAGRRLARWAGAAARPACETDSWRTARSARA